MILTSIIYHSDPAIPNLLRVMIGKTTENDSKGEIV